ncbi:helix-turn-helix transcriptional regulator [Corynebacterium segmentosum]|uniref:helix-turn-helix transcriptional regulator n=1 Tax=Corynebacterium TaxID=1716 RepID=UPI00190B0C4B|nr:MULTISPECIES: excisionase family DNA-binding protein [Corynebacterium]MBK4149824.1 excisionase family DNA-binding protein [Corynebacterium macginleyi]MDK8491575.1 excisionase family DNA-binding protein [Corynebacterium sp. MSK175]
MALPKTAYTIREAASLMGVSNSTMYAAAREGTLPFPVLKVNSRYIVPAKPFLATLGIEADTPKEAA